MSKITKINLVQMKYDEVKVNIYIGEKARTFVLKDCIECFKFLLLIERHKLVSITNLNLDSARYNQTIKHGINSYSTSCDCANSLDYVDHEWLIDADDELHYWFNEQESFPEDYNLDDKLWCVAKNNHTHHELVDASRVLHIQRCVRVDAAMRVWAEMILGLWDDDADAKPQLAYIPCIDKYIVANGNHRITVAASMGMKISCYVATIPDYLNKKISKYALEDETVY
jgi:hypothetical protein